MQAIHVNSLLMSRILYQVQFNLKMSLFCVPDRLIDFPYIDCNRQLLLVEESCFLEYGKTHGALRFYQGKHFLFSLILL